VNWLQDLRKSTEN